MGFSKVWGKWEDANQRSGKLPLSEMNEVPGLYKVEPVVNGTVSCICIGVWCSHHKIEFIFKGQSSML